MRAILFSLISIAVSAFKPRQALALENLALRQQLAIYKRTHRRPQLRSTNKALEDKIVALERQVAEAIKRNDMDAFGSLLTDDYVQVDSAGATPKSVLVK